MAERLDAGLLDFDRNQRPLPGIQNAVFREAFREQLLESIHRIKVVEVIRARQISGRRADPCDELFDPLKAAILHNRRGNLEEAVWLVFLFVHFGRHSKGGWRYAREIYGRLEDGGLWDWEATSQDPVGFRAWLHANHAYLKRPGAGFGNHRKRESLDAASASGTGAVIESYVRWVGARRSHALMLNEALERAGGDPKVAFDTLYHSMDAITRFGRLARFDFLTMLGKLELAPIIPGSAYLEGSSGPVQGARLLFGKHEPARILDAWTVELDDRLGVGMQVLEDSLCNWQKSPDRFVRFRG